MTRPGVRRGKERPTVRIIVSYAQGKGREGGEKGLNEVLALSDFNAWLSGDLGDDE